MDLEGCDCGLSQVLSRHCLGETEEYREQQRQPRMGDGKRTGALRRVELRIQRTMVTKRGRRISRTRIRA
jgi:hypothetical protein